MMIVRYFASVPSKRGSDTDVVVTIESFCCTCGESKSDSMKISKKCEGRFACLNAGDRAGEGKTETWTIRRCDVPLIINRALLEDNDVRSSNLS